MKTNKAKNLGEAQDSQVTGSVKDRKEMWSWIISLQLIKINEKKKV